MWLELIKGYYLNPKHKDNRNDYCYLILCNVLSHEYSLILMLIIRRECDSSPSPGWKTDLPSWNVLLKIIGLAIGWPLAQSLDNITPWPFLHSTFFWWPRKMCSWYSPINDSNYSLQCKNEVLFFKTCGWEIASKTPSTPNSTDAQLPYKNQYTVSMWSLYNFL